MVKLLWNILRDFYLVLLLILVVDLIPGTNLLHDLTRKAVITITVVVVVVKVVQPRLDSALAGGGGNQPKRQKTSEHAACANFEWASSEVQGWRPAMEDAVCTITALDAPLANQALFAVFDGHGGAQVSKTASEEFRNVLNTCARSCQNQELKDGATSGAEADQPADGPLSPGALEQTLHRTMLTLDSMLRKSGQGMAPKLSGNAGPMSQHLAAVEAPEKRNAFNLVGSTAIVVLIDCGEDTPAEGRPRRLCVANIGDSRAVLCRKGRAEELSQDHKPELPGEEERIRRAGGHVAAVGPCYRIDGWGLNLSRALGDFHYKSRSDLKPEEQKVSVVPEIYSLDLNDDDEFLLLACDGCFELFTSQGCVDIVRQQLQAGKTVEKSVEFLLDRCVSDNLMKTRGRGGDNCSAIVVKLK